MRRTALFFALAALVLAAPFARADGEGQSVEDIEKKIRELEAKIA